MTRQLEKTPRFEYYRKGIFFNYKINYSRYFNQYTDSFNEYEEFNFLKVQLNPKWFEVDDWYYDGHRAKEITILGVCFGKGYSYAWQDLKVKS